MIALDTNAPARAIVTHSDADAATRARQRDARALLDSGQDPFVPVTVVQELEWVLRSAYDMPTGDIAELFRDLLSVENVTVDRAAAVGQAIDGYQRGLDFSDALHLALSATCERLASVDPGFIRKSRRMGSKPAVQPPNA